MSALQTWHAYCSVPRLYPPAPKVLLPLYADIIADASGEAWDDTGWYDPLSFGIRIPQGLSKVILEVKANVLWFKLPPGTQLAIRFLKNGIEMRGNDLQVYQLNQSFTPWGQTFSTILKAKAGDLIQAAPWQNSQGVQMLANSINDNINTCNYFEGMIISQQ